MKGKQLELFGISEDQMTFTSELWGVLSFFPSQTNKWTDTCKHCLLWDNKKRECAAPHGQAPCASYERYDGQEGYFAIHDMPK